MDNWDSWHVQHCSHAAASTTHSHPSHSGGNILINTENILSPSVCLYLYLLAPYYLSTHHKGRISLYVTVKSLVYCLWSPMTGSECVVVLTVTWPAPCELSVLSWPTGLPYRQFTWYDMTSLDSQWMFFINKLNRACWYFDIQHQVSFLRNCL